MIFYNSVNVEKSSIIHSYLTCCWKLN